MDKREINFCLKTRMFSDGMGIIIYQKIHLNNQIFFRRKITIRPALYQHIIPLLKIALGRRPEDLNNPPELILYENSTYFLDNDYTRRIICCALAASNLENKDDVATLVNYFFFMPAEVVAWWAEELANDYCDNRPAQKAIYILTGIT